MIQQNAAYPREDRNWSSSSRNRSPSSYQRAGDVRRDDYYASSSRHQDDSYRSRYSENTYNTNGSSRRRIDDDNYRRRSPSPSYRSSNTARHEDGSRHSRSDRMNDSTSRHEYHTYHQSNNNHRVSDSHTLSDRYYDSSSSSRRRAEDDRCPSQSYENYNSRNRHDSYREGDKRSSHRPYEDSPKHSDTSKDRKSESESHRRGRASAADEDEEDGIQQLWRKTNGTSSAHDARRADSRNGSNRNDRKPFERPSLATKILEEGEKEERTDLNDDIKREKYVQRIRQKIIEESTQKDRTLSRNRSRSPATAKTEQTKKEAIKPSFSKILLPHQLLESEDAPLVQLNAKGEKLRSFRLLYDPELEREKDKKGKSVVFTNLSTESADPRNGHSAKRKARKDLRLLTWRWDNHSTRPKPPPPPRSIVISGLSPMTLLGTVKRHFTGFGRINECEIKIDANGMSTGVCFLSFHHDFDDNLKPLESVNESKAQRGDLIAKVAKEKMNGQKIDLAIISIEFDNTDRIKFKKTYRDLIQKRLDAEKAIAESKVNHNSASPSMPPPDAPKGPKNNNVPNHINGRLGITPPKPLSPSVHNRIGGETGKRSSVDAVMQQAKQEAGFTGTKQINSLLAEIGHPYAFVKRVKESSIGFEMICKVFAIYKPLWVKSDALGFYIAFENNEGASTARNALNNQSIAGYKITVDVLLPNDRSSLSSRRTSNLEDDDRRRHSTDRKKEQIPEKTVWTDEELFEDSRLLLMRELGTTFVHDLRSRVLNQFITDLLNEDRSCGKALKEIVKNLDDQLKEEIEVDLNAERPKSFNKAAKEERRRKLLQKQKEDQEAIARALQKASESVSESEEDKSQIDVQELKVRGKKNKKAIPKDGKIKGEEKVVKLVKASKKVVRSPSPLPDPFISGLAEEEEDLYFCRLALEMMQEGEDVQEIPEENEWQSNINGNEESFPPHASGSARTEGFYRIPPAEKGRHLADRNMATSTTTEWVASTTTVNVVGLASARDNRADSRRFVQGIEQHKKETATDTDILKFNQLRSRKKQLKFAKSPIHDWGLYAMEAIPAGDMVIEYVGEIVRQQVADEREKNYERQGNFSTYLFRVDDDIVVDATKKGNIARLMNHCCTPNCNAKILTLNGEKRIVLYAKQLILPGQELTYDYKFQATGDEEDAIACLCGSPGCRRFL